MPFQTSAPVRDSVPGPSSNTQGGQTVTIDNARLHLEDALRGMKAIPDASIDLAIVDPPYGASSGSGAWKLPSDHRLERFGGAWKLAAHEWDRISGMAWMDFALEWLRELRRCVSPTGSIWIHATYHNSGMVNVACQILDLEIINEVVWFKRNAFPNLAGRRLTASHETLLWVHTGGSNRRYRFNYGAVKAAAFGGDSLKAAGKQMRTVWDIPNNKSAGELRFGRHPTQKPLRLAERLILISGVTGGKLLVPFMGSGTEVLAGLRAAMAVEAFETDPSSFELAVRRLNGELNTIVEQTDFL
jgi:site-specific DNA-methyltransferase (adenine-specific)